MNKRNYIIFGSSFLIFLVALVLYRGSMKKMNEYVWRVDHTQVVISAFEKLSGDLKSIQMLPSELGQKHPYSIYELYRSDINDIPADISNLLELIKDDRRQVRRVINIQQIFNDEIDRSKNNNLKGYYFIDSTAGHFSSLIKVERLIDDGIKEEKDLLAKRKSIFTSSLSNTNVLTVIFITIAVLLIISISGFNIYQVKKRQELELFLESVLNTSQNGIITYEAIREKKVIKDFRIIFANDYMEKQPGRNSTGRISKSLLSLSPRGSENHTLERYIRVVETGKKDEFDITYEHNSSLQWFHVILVKLNDGFTATFYDITALKKYERELQEKVSMLQSTNAELEQFAYVASHDLQEPLRKIRTFAGIVRDRFTNTGEDSAYEYLSKVIQAAERMGTLIKDLLNLSHLTQNVQRFGKTDLNAVLKDVLTDLELIIGERKATVTSDRLDEIEAVPLQMSQLFYNLLNNSLKFSKKDVPPVVRITVKQLSPEKINEYNLDEELSYCNITFSDNGIGFNQVYAEKIFVIFQQLNNKMSYAGSGIGLALCRKIVSNHHGLIYAEGREHEGASFHVILPKRQPINAIAQRENVN